MQPFHRLIRAVPDFPRVGVTFRDITPLLAHAQAFAQCIDALAAPWLDQRVQAVCGIEARGFIFGAALAQRLHAGFVPLRKSGKLPPPVVAVDYQLEYGSDRLEARADAVVAGERVLLVDDVLATGGTLAAAAHLLDQLGACVLGGCVVIELDDLGGRHRWQSDAPLLSLLHY